MVEELSPVAKTIVGFIKRNWEPMVGALAGAFVVLAAKIAIATGKMIALNISLMSNPVGLVVLAVGALVAAVTAAYLRFEGFRKIVDAVGRFLRDKLLPIVTDLPGAFMTGFKYILDGVSWLVNGIKNGFQGAFNWVVDKAISFVQSILMPLTSCLLYTSDAADE